MPMHKVAFRYDRKGRVIGKYCPCCGWVSSASAEAKARKNRQLLTSAPNIGKIFGQLSKKPVNGARGIKSAGAVGQTTLVPEKEEEKETGLLGQLKGYFKTRDSIIPRVYRHFEGPPEPLPTRVCFETNLPVSHRDVLLAFKQALQIVANVDGSKVVSLQVIPQKIVFRNRSMSDRWIVELSSKFAVKKMMELGFVLKGQQMYVRPLDEILADEYRQFLGVKRMLKFLVKPGLENQHVLFSRT